MPSGNGVELGPQAVFSVNLRARLRRSADELWVGLGDSYFVLNGPVIRMWELIDGRRGLGDIVSIVAKEYDVSESMVLDDAVESFTPLWNSGVLHVAS